MKKDCDELHRMGSGVKQSQVKQLEHERKINVNEKSLRREKRFAEKLTFEKCETN